VTVVTLDECISFVKLAFNVLYRKGWYGLFKVVLPLIVTDNIQMAYCAIPTIMTLF